MARGKQYGNIQLRGRTNLNTHHVSLGLPPILQTNWVNYVRECKEILELDYGVTKVPVLLYSWVWATTYNVQVGTKKDEFGFTRIHFGRLLPMRE
jgi:hypothetical protein